MSQVQLLTVGSNPNLAFYAWRLHETRALAATLVNPTVNPNHPLSWESKHFGSSSFQPAAVYNTMSQIPQSSDKFDMVILSVSSLQDFQVYCNNLLPYVNDDSIIVIESTGYINLEPFVQLSLPKTKNLVICSIMNEADVRQLSSNLFHHNVKNKDNRIYLGTSVDNPQTSRNPSFQRFYKLLQLVQEDLRDHITLLKSTVPKEFMTYQWKLALPRIVFNPLLIIFEETFPANLSSQILSKPLITGIINEIFKIVKKMDCKLVKGSENEANLLKHWCNCFPITTATDNYLHTNQLFYNFYHQRDMEIDLLLLQPILLGDDHGVRTPYLENLYSMMCQLIKINSKDSRSLLFQRKRGDLDSHLLSKQEALTKVSKDHQDKLNQVQILSQDIAKYQAEKQQVDNYIKEKQVLRSQIDEELAAQQERLRSLTLTYQEQQEKLRLLDKQYVDRVQEHERHYAELKAKSAEVQPAPAPVSDVKQVNKSVRDSVVPNDNLEDLADIAIYGAQINGESIAKPEPEPAQPSLSDKELELQRREQALLTRELAYQETSRQNSHGSEYYQAPPHQRYYQPSPVDQQPPQGLPTNGLPPANMPNFKKQVQYPPAQNQPPTGQYQPPAAPAGQYQPAGQYPPPGQYQQPAGQYQQPAGPYQQGYQAPQGQQGYQAGYNGPQYGNGYAPQPLNSRQRLSSIPLSVNSYYEQGQPQAQHQYQGQPQGFQGQPPFQGQGQPPFQGQGQPGQYGYAKKNNRRSGFPGMDDTLLRIDYGGRGGMPTSSMHGAGAKAAKHKLMLPGTSGNMLGGPANAPQRKSMSGAQMLKPQGGVGHLQPPLVNGSNALTNSSSNSGETPKTGSTDNIRIDVPVLEVEPKPLGTVAAPVEKKKKKGLFSKK